MLEPGPSTIGRYELIQEIARGGMAVLYLAREVGIEGFEKVVVVKRMLPEFRANDEYLAMFLDEARIGASLQHANLPHVYELGREHGEYFFAMEYLHGADLQRIIKAMSAQRRELPLEHAISIQLGLCAGLHCAHERRTGDGAAMNLVHRDVSPKNVLVTYDGSVKLLDFGIARADKRQSETTDGTVKGTLEYMSPEQIRGGVVDRRTDVFAACIVLWEMTTGSRLFTGPSEFVVMDRIIDHDAAAPSTVRPGYPPELERIVMRGLRRVPDERFQNAEELQLALEKFARDHRLATSPVGLARFMRELYSSDVADYEDAKEHGKLATRALAEVATWKKQRDDHAVAIPAESSPQKKRTRQLEPGPVAGRARRWPLVVLVAGVLVSVIVWRLRHHASGSASPADATTMTMVPPDATTTAPAPAPPDASPPEPTPSVQVRPKRKPERVGGNRGSASETKSMTDDDLDAVLPPHK